MPSSINKTTRFEYNLDGNMVKLIAENPTTGDQVTEWVYGVTAAQGSQVESKALVYQKVYPDSSGAADRVTYTYNRQGQVTQMTDQAGTVHGYAFDGFGRIVEDSVTAFGTGIDQTVKAITRSYEVRGMLEKVGSLGAGGTTLNEVELAYNDYAQLARDYQSHSGPVNTSSTLFVGYSYADGSANTVRRTGITYPDGTTTITTAYVGADADALSRPDALKEGSETLCSYRYLGGGVFIGVKYDAASGVELTYQDGGTGDAGDKYTGLDRFGRLIETLWKKGTTAQVQSQYGRNRFGGVVWRKDLTAHAQSVTTEDNFYQYDELYQVKEHQRGNLTGTPPSGITGLQQEEDWTYDATGNWDSYTNSAPSSSQSRTNNQANEITSITNPGGTLSPSYDPVGNMLTMPTEPGTTTGQYTLQWDAWNRLVEVKDGSASVASYTYDGQTRRLTKTSASETRHYYYSDQWRAVEERVAGATIAVDRQYTWGLRDRWDMLRRKRSTGGSSLNEVRFCLRDYLDPVGIVGTDGLIKERYAYDAFGGVRFLAPDYSSRSTSFCDWEFLFHAEFRDSDTKLYNYGYRYYDASLGRWLSRDPLFEKSARFVPIGQRLITKADQTNFSFGELGFNEDLANANYFETHESGRISSSFRIQSTAMQPSYAFVSNDPISNFDARGLFQKSSTPLTVGQSLTSISVTEVVGDVTLLRYKCSGQLDHCWFCCDCIVTFTAVQTGPDSRAELLGPDGTVFRIGQNTFFNLNVWINGSEKCSCNPNNPNFPIRVNASVSILG